MNTAVIIIKINKIAITITNSIMVKPEDRLLDHFGTEKKCGITISISEKTQRCHLTQAPALALEQGDTLIKQRRPH